MIHTEFATDETSQKLLTICNSLPRDAVEAALTELGESAGTECTLHICVFRAREIHNRLTLAVAFGSAASLRAALFSL